VPKLKPNRVCRKAFDSKRHVSLAICQYLREKNVRHNKICRGSAYRIPSNFQLQQTIPFESKIASFSRIKKGFDLGLDVDSAEDKVPTFWSMPKVINEILEN
jgi:hypothetical protein